MRTFSHSSLARVSSSTATPGYPLFNTALDDVTCHTWSQSGGKEADEAEEAEEAGEAEEAEEAEEAAEEDNVEDNEGTNANRNACRKQQKVEGVRTRSNKVARA